MKRTSPSLVLSYLLLAATIGSALADVDVTVETGDKIQGSIASADTRDTYRINCPAGATLKATAKGKKGMRPTVSIERPKGDLDPMKGGTTAEDGPLATSGVHVVTVSAEPGAGGDYALAITSTVPKKTTTAVTLGAEETTVPFSAPAGTTLKLKVQAAKGSAAVPRILRVEGPRGFRLDLVAAGKVASDSLGKTVLPNDGDYRVIVDDAGDTGGAANVTVQLKQPKAAKRKLDLRDRAIGGADGERLAVSDVIDETGGSVGVPFASDGGPDSLIGGANVAVPAGALTSPTPIVVATSSDVKPRGDSGGAGPSVFFGPEGLTFSTDVDVTIPFDVEQFDGDFSTLQVFTRDARGRVSLVDGPYDVDLDSGTCTFQVAHFSSFRAARAGAGGGGKGNDKFVGAWRQVTGVDPTDLIWLVISPNGGVETIAATTESSFCVRAFTFQGPLQLDLIFDIVSGRLVLTDGQDTIEYIRANIADVPTNCEQL